MLLASLAPIAAIVGVTATLYPKRLPVPGEIPNDCLAESVQVVDDLEVQPKKMKEDPALELDTDVMPGPPTTTVDPEIETLKPNRFCKLVPFRVILFASVHVVEVAELQP